MSPETTSTLGLEDARHERNRRWEWRVERGGMALMAAVLLAAGLGLFGSGLLSRGVATSAAGQVVVEHEVIQRYQAPSRLVIRWPGSPSEGAVVRLRLSRSFADRAEIEGISPEPEATELAEDFLVYSFRMAEPIREGHILIRFKHEEVGPIDYQVEVDGTTARLWEFVLP